jgi:hypothetical protein
MLEHASDVLDHVLEPNRDARLDRTLGEHVLYQSVARK